MALAANRDRSESIQLVVFRSSAKQHHRSSSPVVYRLRVLEAGAQRIVIATENVSPIRAFLVTLFPPGSLRAVYFLERRGPGAWRRIARPACRDPRGILI